MWNDFRLAVRLLSKDSRLTVTAVLVLGVGMAATTTIFTLANGAYLRELPFATPDRIVTVGIRYTEEAELTIDNLSFPDLQDLRASTRAFDGIGVADRATMDLADEAQPAERLDGAYVSADMFALIGQQPVLGRDFTDPDDRRGAMPTVMLSHGVWQRRYGGDAGIIGRSVRVNGLPATVIGVMPERFGFPTRAELWMPVAAAASDLDDRGNRHLDAFGRLAAGVSVEQAESDLSAVLDGLARAYPATNANTAGLVRPFREMNTSGQIGVVFTGLMTAVMLLLLIACANVANLLLARGATRAREIAIRLSLGASRGQIARQLLAESLVLAATGGVAGLLAAAFGVRLVQAGITGTGEPYWLDFPMDWRVFAFVGVTCLGTAVLAGLAPARYAVRTVPAGLLNEANRLATSSPGARRMTEGLVVLQIALSLTLLTGAGLMGLNMIRFSRMDAGVETEGLVVAEIGLPPQRYPTLEDRRRFYRQLDERLAGRPGMRAGVGARAPLGGATARRVSLDGRPSSADAALATAFTLAIGPGYLETLGVGATRGRLFAADDPSAVAIAVVNERFARRHFPDGAVGRSIWLEAVGPNAEPTGPLTIVGVVRDVRQASPRQDDPGLSRTEPEPVVYLPYSALALSNATIIARSDAEAGAVAAFLRESVHGVDPDLPVSAVGTFGQRLQGELSIFVTFSSLFGVFAVSALGLSAIGLYGVVAFAVARRTRELGIRLALGAQARHIWWAVSRRASLQLAFGIALGLVGAFGAGRLLGGVMFLADSRDPLLLYGLPALMVVVALLACAGPARRAMRLDPATTLRAE